MSAIEGGRRKLIEQAEVSAVNREIFTTAIGILETNGQPVKNLLFFEHQVFQRAMNSRKPEVNVYIKAGVDLKKARKVSLHIQGVGWLDVRKTGVEGQEKFKGKSFRENSTYGYGENLDGTLFTHLGIVKGYLVAINQVRNEITPKPTS